MAPHECKHEADFGAMAAGIANIEKTVDKIDKRLFGNGGNDGLVVRLSTIENKVKWLPAPKTILIFAMVGGGLAVIAYKFLA